MISKNKHKSKLVSTFFREHLRKPDLYVFGPPGSGSVSHKYGSSSGSRSFHHQAKIVRKTLISSVLFLPYDFLPLFRLHIWIRMFWGVPDPHPDPLVRGTNPRIRIRTNMSRISNTGPPVSALSNLDPKFGRLRLV
jgi:hypothetical protein